MKIRRLASWIGGVICGLLVLLFLLPLGVSFTLPGALIRCLPFGWWRFLQRNLAQVTWNWSLIATGLVCSFVIVVLGNWLLAALFRQLQESSRPNQPVRRWSWRWTLGLYAAVWVLFLIAFGAAGVLRHSAWLMAYDGPWYRPVANSYAELMTANAEISQLLLDNDHDLEATRRDFQREVSYRHRGTLMADEIGVIFFGDRSNRVAAYLIIPRREDLIPAGKFWVLMPETNGEFKPISELHRTIANLDAMFPRAGR